ARFWVRTQALAPVFLRPATFYDRDLPAGASHCGQEECGFSIYRGVLVQWDEDHDERIFKFLDQLPAKILDKLLVVQEHEASLVLVWAPSPRIPKCYQE